MITMAMAWASRRIRISLLDQLAETAPPFHRV